MPKTSRTVLNIIGKIALFASIFFIIYTIVKFDIDFSSVFTLHSIVYIIILTLVYSLVVILGNSVWKFIIEFLSCRKISGMDSFCVYTKSNLGKYLPGNFMHFANRQIFAASLGLTQSQIALASIIEMFFLCFTSLLLSAAFAGNFIFEFLLQRFSDSSMILIIALLLLISISIIIVLYNNNPKFRKFFSQFLNFKFLLLSIKCFILLSVNFLILGITYIIILNIYTSVNVFDAFIPMAAVITSWFIGFVTPGAPGGLGVRETVLTIMLSGLYDKDIILMAAIVHRLIFVLGDFTIYLSGLFINKISIRYNKLRKFKKGHKVGQMVE